MPALRYATLIFILLVAAIWPGFNHQHSSMATPEPSQFPELDLPTEELSIAYIGNDGNVWIADLANQEKSQVTTDGFFSETQTSMYNNPEWSPDGTMLTFHIYPWGNDQSILWWDGETVHAIPGTKNCVNPHFNSAGDRLLFSCPDFVNHQSPNPPDADTDPRAAIVTSVKLDGTDMRREISYVAEGTTGVLWNPGGSRLKNAVLTDVDSTTGNMLVSGYEHGPFGWAIFAQDGTQISDDLGGIYGKDGPFQQVFADENQALLVRICDTNCTPGRRDTTRKMVKVDFEGNVLAEYPALFGAADILGYADIPGSDYVIVSAQVTTSTPPYLMLVSPTTAPRAFELGMHPALRPVVEDNAT